MVVITTLFSLLICVVKNRDEVKQLDIEEICQLIYWSVKM